MGEYSKVVFGRNRIPSRAIISAGVYFARRKDAFRRVFDYWEKLKGREWIRYSFARVGGKDYTILFGIYGAAMMLETVQCLRDGGVETIEMVGSMGARRLPVGSIVIPTSAVDRAGVVSVDDPEAAPASPDQMMLELTRKELRSRNLPFTEGKILSVPAVLHGIEHLEASLKRADDIVGHEMEASTLLHFARKHGIRAGALLYVSDNDRHSIIAGSSSVVEARRWALGKCASVAVNVLWHL